MNSRVRWEAHYFHNRETSKVSRKDLQNEYMNEKEQIEQTVAQAKRELKFIEKCRLPLSIYDVPETKVEEIQTKMLLFWKEC